MPAGVGYPPQQSPLGASAAQQQALAPKVMPAPMPMSDPMAGAYGVPGWSGTTIAGPYAGMGPGMDPAYYQFLGSLLGGLPGGFGMSGGGGFAGAAGGIMGGLAGGLGMPGAPPMQPGQAYSPEQAAAMRGGATKSPYGMGALPMDPDAYNAIPTADFIGGDPWGDGTGKGIPTYNPAGQPPQQKGGVSIKGGPVQANPGNGGVTPDMLATTRNQQQPNVAAAPGATNVPSPAMPGNPQQPAQAQPPGPTNPANQGGQPLNPQPPNPPQGSYQQQPSAYNDFLTSLFNASSGIDTTQLDQTLGAIQNNATRTASSQASNVASQALGSGAAGTPVAQMANSAVGDVLAQSQALQNQTSLDYLLGRSGQNIQGLSSGTQLALGGENQAFNQQLASQQQNMDALGMLMDAGALPRQLEQANMQAQMAEWLRLQGADDATIAQLTGLAGGTPFFQQQGVVPPNYGALAIGGVQAGIGAYNALSPGATSPPPQTFAPLAGPTAAGTGPSGGPIYMPGY